MKAIFYGICPVPPGQTITVTRWNKSVADHLVFLGLTDQQGVRWLGPQFPLGLQGGPNPYDEQSAERLFRVTSTEIDTVKGWTIFDVERVTR
jgi:hypothetical protein